MSKTKRRIGRPTLDAEGPRGSKIAFRPKNSVRKYLENQVAAGDSISIGTAINEAIDRARMSDVDVRQELYRTFGGKHNLMLAWLLARIAVGIEHKRKKSWTESPEGLFQVLLATTIVLREFLPRGWKPEEEGTFNAWGEIAAEALDGLNSSDRPWWPLSDSHTDERWIPLSALWSEIASLPRRDDPKIDVHPELKKAIQILEWLNLDWITENIEDRIAVDVQKEIEEGGRSVEDYQLDELVQMGYEKRWQMYVEGTNKESKDRSQTTETKDALQTENSNIIYAKNLFQQSAA